MNTDDFINQMVNEGAKKPLPHPVKQTLCWLCGTLFYLAVLSGYKGFRSDMAEKLLHPLYLSELAILFFIASSAALAALYLSRPDGCRIRWITLMPFYFLALWALSAFFGALGEISWADIFNSVTQKQFDCPLNILMLSFPPGIAIFLIVRKGAATQCCRAAGMATLSVTAFGYFCMRLIEQNDNPAHLIVWHALPIMIACLAGMMLGKHVFRWR